MAIVVVDNIRANLDFRDPNLLLNTKNTVTFRPGMVFSLAISFAGLKLSENVRASLNSKSAVSLAAKNCLFVCLFKFLCYS